MRLTGAKRSAAPRGPCRGQSVVEFAVALPFLVLITIGSFAVGIVLDRHMTVGQVVRNGGNMFARGIDFASNQNKQFIIDAASGLDLELASGRTVVYFSLLARVPEDAICDSGTGPGDCLNQGEVVIAERYRIGAAAPPDAPVGSAMASKLAMPGDNFVDKSGAPATEGIVHKTSGGQSFTHFDFAEAVATGAPPEVTDPTNGLQPNEVLYAVEVIHRPEAISFHGIFAPEFLYSRAFF